MKMKKIKLNDYIEILTDYHSGGSYKTLKENTKILYEPDYAVMIRTLNFEANDFVNNLIYCDKKTYDFLKYSNVRENDILMNKIATPGNVYLMPKVPYKVTCGMNLFLLRFKNINQKYMYYVMKKSEEYIKSFAHGTTTKTITKQEVRDLEFYIHDCPEDQNRIARLFSSFSEKIYNNIEKINTLEKMISDIYDYWFVQFNFPDNNKPYKDNGGSLKYSEELGKHIPYFWEVKKLLNIVNWRSNSQPPKSAFIYEEKDGYIRFIQNRDYDSDSYLTYVPYKNTLKTVNKFDILMDKYGDAGRVRYGLEGAFNVALGHIEVTLNNGVEYIRSFLQSDHIYGYLKNSCMASTRASLSKSNLTGIDILIPDNKTLVKWENSIHKIRNEILELKSENRQLKEYMDFLLPNIFSKY